jgi:Domain of unknown function (DUF4386)
MNEPQHPQTRHDLDAGPYVRRTAGITGLAYLGLAVSGAVGFLLVRSQLYVPDDAAATLANLMGHTSTARLGIAADLTVVLTQAVAALWFYKLFRPFDSFAAGALAAFGLVNAVAVLVATMFSATALQVSLAAPGAVGLVTPGDRAATAQLMYELNGAAWGVGGLFFGLWLIPMGWLAWRHAGMPRVLGWVLIGGGIGYLVSTFVSYLVPNADTLAGVLTGPATVGEFWMIGYLLVTGLRPVSPSSR